MCFYDKVLVFELHVENSSLMIFRMCCLDRAPSSSYLNFRRARKGKHNVFNWGLIGDNCRPSYYERRMALLIDQVLAPMGD